MSDEKASYKSKILIVDDQKAIHEDFEKILIHNSKDETKADALIKEFFGKKKERELKNDFILESAFQGEDAVTAVQKALIEMSPYKVAFIDMRMPPGWDGLKTIEEIWKIDHNIQTVLCTAYSDYSWEEIIDRLGNSDRLLILKKPFDKIEVMQLSFALCNKWTLTYDMNQLIEKQAVQIREQEKQLFQNIKLKALGEMAGGIAHEINNPLTIINGHIIAIDKIIQKGDLKNIQDIRDHIGLIKKMITRVSSIITNMKKLTRNCEKDSRILVTCKEIIESVQSVCCQKFVNTKIDFDIEAITEELKVFSIGTQLHQALMNIVFNAYDAVSDGPNKWIKIKCIQAEGFANIIITNSGKRIPGDMEQNIFDPFFTTKDPGKGTGLGLSISKKIIEEHGGELFLNKESKN